MKRAPHKVLGLFVFATLLQAPDARAECASSCSCAELFHFAGSHTVRNASDKAGSIKLRLECRTNPGAAKKFLKGLGSLKVVSRPAAP